MKKMVPVPAMRSFLEQDFPTLLGRSLPHLLVLMWDQISADDPLRSLSREVCFPAASWGGVVRAEM